ncbi:tetratricopeptide repeat protein [Streptomyces sp. R11]|uniref:Tetratricopeptide repeat protein n=1 Tax=Streptomyces sp. R11 TaxID=3238625 RepID=A0AB39NBY0_9ACTN
MAELLTQAVALHRSGEPAQALDHARLAVSQAQSDHLPSAVVANALLIEGTLLAQTPAVEEAVAVLRTAQHAASADPGPGALHMQYHVSLALGRTLRTAGRYRDAEHELRRLLTFTEERLSPDSPETAFVLNELGMVHRYAGHFDEAAQIYQKALTLVETHVGPDSTEAAAVLHNLAGLAHARGDHRTADRLARQGIAIRVQADGPHSPSTAADRAAYAAILIDLHRVAEAQEILREVLAAYERLYGRDHYEVAVTLHNLAAAQAATGDHTGAAREFARAARIKMQVLGPRHPELATTLCNLAQVLLRAGDIHQARRHAIHCVDILESVVDPAHPTLAAARTLLASLDSNPAPDLTSDR